MGILLCFGVRFKVNFHVICSIVEAEMYELKYYTQESLTYFPVELWVIHATFRCYVLCSFSDY